MTVHNINADSFLLVAVNIIFSGQPDQTAIIIIGNFLVAEIQLPEQVAIFTVRNIDQLEDEQLGIVVTQ